mgnify:CR=1 FL=1
MISLGWSALAGIGLGGLYFGGLWLTVRGIAGARHPAPVVVGSYVARLALVLRSLRVEPLRQCLGRRQDGFDLAANLLGGGGLVLGRRLEFGQGGLDAGLLVVLQLFFLLLRDLAFHLLGACSWPSRFDRDRGRLDFRDQLHRHPDDGDQAEQDYQALVKAVKDGSIAAETGI